MKLNCLSPEEEEYWRDPNNGPMPPEKKMTELEWFRKHTGIQSPSRMPIDRLTIKVVDTLLDAIGELPPQPKGILVYMLVCKIQMQDHERLYPPTRPQPL